MNKLKKSWTLWFNSACAVLVLMLPEIQVALEAQLTPDQYRQAASIFILVNVALRFKTAVQAQSVTLRDEHSVV